MKSKLTQLAERREHLVAQAAAQRAALAQNLEPWRAPLALADRCVAALRYFKRHPALLVGAALMIAALGRKRTGRRLSRLWMVLRLGQKLLRN